MSDTVLTKRENGIMTITMNRPDVLNALDMELCDALNREILSVEQDNDIRCVVIRGGEQFMSVGDIKYFSENIIGQGDDTRIMFESFINRVL